MSIEERAKAAAEEYFVGEGKPVSARERKAVEALASCIASHFAGCVEGEKVCEWIVDVDGDARTSCRRIYSLGNDGFNFCPYCGGKITLTQ